MARWLGLVRLRPVPVIRLRPGRTWYSSVPPTHPERVEVPCASSGSITVDLHRMSDHPLTSPLLICIPPFSHLANENPAVLPSFAERYPTAVINYRWPDTVALDDGPSTQSNGLLSKNSEEDPQASSFTSPLHWPNPIHDVLFGYEWITSNLAPRTRRDIYVYGSYLGASLATSLALTESYSHQRMAVRGLVAYNGVYNWTTFLPEHPNNNSMSKATGHDLLSLPPSPEPAGSSTFHHMRQRIPALFSAPSNLFDPFASPCLFFHTSGMWVPSDFSDSSLPRSLISAIDSLSLEPLHAAETEPAELDLKPPRKGYLAFPPRQSSLRIPHSLILHDAAPPPTAKPRRRRAAATTAAKTKKKKPKAGDDSFGAQAGELAALMRRSVNKLELKERMKWDEDFDDWDCEAERRVQVRDVGAGQEGDVFGVPPAAEEAIRRWLEERMG